MNALLSRIRARKAELLAQAKTKGTFVVSDEDRVKALEAPLARQRAGSPAPGDAEKIRAIEALVDQQKAKEAAPGPVASAVVQRRHNGTTYHEIDHGAGPAEPRREYPDAVLMPWPQPAPTPRASGAPVSSPAPWAAPRQLKHVILRQRQPPPLCRHPIWSWP